MSLASTYLSRKELIADNLQSMGVVDASGDDGLTTLANKILDIEPSISGLNLDTGITVHSSDDSCLIGQSIMFWAELTAVYDDDTQVDVDLSGVLTGATVVFKSGNTVLGTGVTDNNGIASYTHTFEHTGEYSVTASFAGTENFDSCTSSAINIDVTYKMTITSDKSILSYNNHDVATITATLEDDAAGVSGETLSYEILDKNDNVLDSGSDVTDASGEIEFTYNSLGIGDVTVVVYYGMILQETFVIHDVYYANIGTTDKSSDFDIANLKVMNNLTKGTLSVTNDSEKYTFTATGFGNQALINIPNLNGLDTDYKYSAIVENMGLIVYNTPVLFGRIEAPTGRAVYSSNWASPDWHTINTALNNLASNTEYELQIISNGSSFTIKILDLNGTQLGSWSYTNSSLNNSSNTVYLGVYCFNGTGTLRNLTLELL